MPPYSSTNVARLWLVVCQPLDHGGLPTIGQFRGQQPLFWPPIGKLPEFCGRAWQVQTKTLSRRILRIFRTNHKDPQGTNTYYTCTCYKVWPRGSPYLSIRKQFFFERFIWGMLVTQQSEMKLCPTTILKQRGAICAMLLYRSLQYFHCRATVLRLYGANLAFRASLH